MKEIGSFLCGLGVFSILYSVGKIIFAFLRNDEIKNECYDYGFLYLNKLPSGIKHSYSKFEFLLFRVKDLLRNTIFILWYILMPMFILFSIADHIYINKVLKTLEKRRENYFNQIINMDFMSVEEKREYFNINFNESNRTTYFTYNDYIEWKNKIKNDLFIDLPYYKAEYLLKAANYKKYDDDPFEDIDYNDMVDNYTTNLENQ